MSADRKFENVFVLCAGRNGSVSFAEACKHITNFTSGHESRANVVGEERLDYPSGHIEVDNRLCWFLGRLDRRYGDRAFYVHLTRDPAKIAESYGRRWGLRHSIVSAYNYQICMQHEANSQSAADMVDTVNQNIDLFLKDKTNVITIDIDDPESGFRNFSALIGATGDIDTAVAKFSQRENINTDKDASRGSGSLNIDVEIMNLKSQRDKALNEVNKLVSYAKQEKLKYAEKSQYYRLKLKSALSVKEEYRTKFRKYKTKYRKKRKQNWILAAPYLIVLFPVSIPLGIVRFLKIQRKKNEAPVIENPVQKAQKVSRSTIYKAFFTYQTEGIDAALNLLTYNKDTTPAGSKPLFRSINAKDDADFLENFNAFATQQSIPAIELADNKDDRFYRIRFASTEAVSAPDKISVIMPAFNCEDTIELAMRSILDQTWDNLELLVVDDCSTDNTVRIVETIASKDDRVRLLRNSVNAGPYVSKNRALNFATGTFITGHDADDIALPSRLAIQVGPLIENTRYEGTIGYMMRLSPNAGFSTPARIGEASYNGIFRLASISLMIRRETLINQLGYWDTVRFGADSEMIARAHGLLDDRLVRIETPLMFCLDGADSLTNHQTFGINTETGVSSARVSYTESWRVWHEQTPPDKRYLPYPHLGENRKFSAPPEMSVDDNIVMRIDQ